MLLFTEHHLQSIWEVKRQLENVEQEDIVLPDKLFWEPNENINNILKTPTFTRDRQRKY